jgi:hypothetical protein
MKHENKFEDSLLPLSGVKFTLKLCRFFRRGVEAR